MRKLQGVADTLYIPLTARIQVPEGFPDFFYDEAAQEKDLQDGSIEKNSGQYFYMESVCCYHVVDSNVREFKAKHEKCNGVNLGAGLEISYFRLKLECAVFYEMDLPEVIEVRRRVQGEQENDILIGQRAIRRYHQNMASAGENEKNAMQMIYHLRSVFMSFDFCTKVFIFST